MNNETMNNIWRITAICLFVAGCSQPIDASQPTVVSLSNANNTSATADSLPAQTQTVSLTPVDTTTPTVKPSLTATQTVTPKPTSTPRNTPTKRPSPTQYATPVPDYKLITDTCNLEGCLFQDQRYPNLQHWIIGVATINGYYMQVERADFVGTQFCDSFVIVSGSQELIDAFVALVDLGNGVNSKNELNQPVINIDLDAVEEADRLKVLTSDPDQSVEMVVLRPELGGHDAAVCESFIEIISVK